MSGLDFNDPDAIVARVEAGELTDDEHQELVDFLLEDDDDEPTFEEVLTDAAPEINAFKLKLGRPLLKEEMERLLEVNAEQYDRGDDIDPEAAWQELQERGQIKPLDLDKPSERTDFMTQRLADNEPEPEFRESYDLNDPEQKAEYMGLRFQGYDIAHLNKENQDQESNGDE